MVTVFRVLNTYIMDFPKEPAGNGKHPKLVRYEKIVPVAQPSTRTTSCTGGVKPCEVFIRKHKLLDKRGE